MEKKLVMDSMQAQRTLNRVAMEIIEHYYGIKEVCLVGVKGMGSHFAEMLYACILDQKPTTYFTLTHLIINKKESENMQFQLSDELTLQAKTLIMVDDVLNSGKTLFYGAAFLAQQKPAEISTAVLVNRVHRKFPIFANFVGKNLNTTTMEHITVSLNENNALEAFLD
ncbi:MAG: phosphoribosyltransferase family protein [Luteibaculaceae bacterium]